MKTVLLSMAFLSLTSLGYAQGKGMKFEQGKSWEQIKTKAKAEKKYIFMDVFATWCAPCKAMDRDTYPSERVGSFMNNKFISVRVQADQTKEDDEKVRAWYKDAKKVLEDYHITGYPSFLFFSPNSKLINKGLGYKDSSALIELAGEALDPEKQYYTQIEKFKQGRLEFKKMPELVLKAKSFGEAELSNRIADNYIDNYLFKLKESDLLTKEYLTFISGYLGNKNSKAFKLFTKQSEKVNSILGYYQAQTAVMSFINKKYLPQDAKKSEKSKWEKLESIVVTEFGELGKEIYFGQRMIYHWFLKDDWQSFVKYYTLYYQMSLRHPRRYDINNITWYGVFEHVDDPKVLDFAITVMEYDLENYDQNNSAAYDTYANLLYKAGHKEKAIEWEERAVKLSNLDKGLLETLQKMKNDTKTWPDTVAKP